MVSLARVWWLPKLATILLACSATIAGSALADSALAGSAIAEGRNVLVGVNDRVFLNVDAATGEASAVTGVGFGGFGDVEGLAYDANTRTLYGVDNVDHLLIAIDPVTGTGTTIGPIEFDDVWALAFDPNTNTLYGSVTFSPTILAIDPATGHAEAVGTFGKGLVGGLAFDAETNTLFGIEDEHAIRD